MQQGLYLCGVHKPCPLLREATVPALVILLLHWSHSQTNDHGIWPGNETTCLHVYKVIKWCHSQSYKMVSFTTDSNHRVL